ncbi:hypothetical protein N7463_009932 [Penicillium fimorum]|uniref:Protein kinase domain-containing protein n=1 Tax=Penicillium fimorum TaxID=1882269 RepID=A0A9W9XJM7_9EURO|nr:hypothetical protein N7463_009932 [Penicillium fimorum]
MENIDRKIRVYSLPGVTSTRCFRKLYGVIDNSTIVLEWLDTTLAELRYKPNDIGTHSLIASVIRAAITSCVVLVGSKYLNIGNILPFSIGSDSITAKVGDLGLVVPVGEPINAQPYAMRAPEGFLGQACAEWSQVWAEEGIKTVEMSNQLRDLLRLMLIHNPDKRSSASSVLASREPQDLENLVSV